MTVSVAQGERPAVAGAPDLLSRCAIVVTHYRTPELLHDCLTKIIAEGINSEIIVCDSDADPRAVRAALQAGGRVRYIPFSSNVGFGALVNAGIGAALAEYVLVLNADVMVDGAGLRHLLQTLHDQQSIGIVAPGLAHLDGTPQPSAFAFHRPSTVIYRRTALGRTARGRKELARFEAPAEQALGAGAPSDVDWALGAAMLVRKSAAEAIGPMDAKYFLYFEDVDWCLRMWQAGWRVVVSPTARFRHGYAQASRKHGLVGIFTNRLLRVHLRSAVRFFRMHGLSPQRPQVPPAVIDLRQA